MGIVCGHRDEEESPPALELNDCVIYCLFSQAARKAASEKMAAVSLEHQVILASFKQSAAYADVLSSVPTAMGPRMLHKSLKPWCERWYGELRRRRSKLKQTPCSAAAEKLQMHIDGVEGVNGRDKVVPT